MISPSRSLPFAICAFACLLAGLPVSSSRGQTPPVASAEPTSFDEVTARLDRGGSFFMYLSTAQWLNGLSDTLAGYRPLLFPPAAKPNPDGEKAFELGLNLLKQSGLEQISGVGLSSILVQPGIWRNTAFLHHARGQDTGLLGATFGNTPHPLKALDLLPANTALAAYCDFDAQRVIGSLLKELQRAGIPEVTKAVDDAQSRFALLTGMPLETVLQTLGGAGGFIVTLDPAKPIEVNVAGKPQTIPNPRGALLIEVRDDRLFQRLDQVIGGFPGVIKVDEPALRMRTMVFPASGKVSVRTTVAQTAKLLILSSDDGLVREILAAQASGQGFKATPEFAKLSAGLPGEGNGFSVVTQTLVDAWKKIQADLVNSQPNGDAAHEALMHKMMDAQSFGPTYPVSGHVDNGWLTVSRGGQSMSQMMLPLMIIPAAIGASTAIPFFAKAKAQAAVGVQGDADRLAKSEGNARQIYAACKAYAADHAGKFPPSLNVLVPKYMKDRTAFVSPYKPKEPMGYAYTPGLTVDSAADTVLITDKFTTDEEESVAIHVDGSSAGKP